MDISVIVIGDELLLGRVADTNSGFIARTVEPLGWRVAHVEIVGDNAADIADAVGRALARHKVVLTTGGLGPTKDDITKGALCSCFGGSLKRDPAVLSHVERVMASRGREINELTRTQADVPTSCRVIQNEVGTAPLMWFESADGSVLVAMPGVPFETERMFPEAVIPELKRRFAMDTPIHHRSLLVTDMSESAIAEKIADIEAANEEVAHIAYLPTRGYVHLRIDSADAAVAECVAGELAKRLADHVFARKDAPVAQILLERLRERHLTVSTAESCTGGNIAHLITSIPGSSEAMMGAVVAYSNSVKMSILGVDEATLGEHGAVSIPVVEQMVAGACRVLGTDVAIATSGIAGPGGGTPAKPVGTVCIAVKCGETVIAETRRFAGDRQRVITNASTAALIMAIRAIDRT